jgi:hypothetical protein
MREAGLGEVTELPPRDTILGRVSYWRASDVSPELDGT